MRIEWRVGGGCRCKRVARWYLERRVIPTHGPNFGLQSKIDNKDSISLELGDFMFVMEIVDIKAYEIER